jgi:hypothetical protein
MHPDAGVMKRMDLARRSVGDGFGSWLAPLGTGLGWWALRGADAVGRQLDRIFFPNLDRTPIERPVILVGLPRSGTTFLHRFLVDNGVGVGQELWRMLLPSPSLQALARPFLPLMERVSPSRFHDPRMHETGLTQVETDDVAVLFRHFDGFFLYAFALSHAEQDLRDVVDPEVRDVIRRDLDTLADQWQRTLVATGGKRIIAKIFSALGQLPAVLDRFPDARVVVIVRDPMESIPSTLSLITNTLHNRFGFWGCNPELRQRTIQRLYTALVALQDRFLDDWQSGRILCNQIEVVTFPGLVNDFDATARRLLHFLDHTIDDQLDGVIRAIDLSQRQRRSEHHYDLSRFGLEPERVKADTARTHKLFLKDHFPAT